jgi:hypothetical protein
MACVAALAVGCGARGPVTETGPPPTTNPPAVEVVQATTAELSALDVAYGEFWNLPPSVCPADALPSSVKTATVESTGVSWAIARFQPGAGCSLKVGTATPGVTVAEDPYHIPAFLDGAGDQPPLGVFERPDGGGWRINSTASYPFPCPALYGLAPGPGNGAVPADVLQAWGLAYAANCAEQS